MNAKTRRAYQFFRHHAGYIVGENAKGALHLAKAEAALLESDVECLTEEDPYCDWSFVETWTEKEQDEWHKSSHAAYTVSLVRPCPEHGTDCPHAEVLASLSGVVDPDAEYLRVVRAELALEAGFGSTITA